MLDAVMLVAGVAFFAIAICDAVRGSPASTRYCGCLASADVSADVNVPGLAGS